MTDLSRPHHKRFARAIACGVALLLFIFAGCESAPRNAGAISAYYAYDFTTAREALRRDAMLIEDEQLILNNTRLGMAALADGDLSEAETALGTSFEYLSTAGLNKDRTISAVLVHEGVRIWKGEPFEQALTYSYVATLYAMLGDWENARAAAANSLFRLTDFGSDQVSKVRAMNEAGYTAVDTNFALGFLLQAIGSDLSGAPGSEDQLDAAVEINPALQPIADVLRKREYDMLLVIDYGKGPTKISYGPDESLVRFLPQERAAGPLVVRIDEGRALQFAAACDVNAMAVDHRWNNLEDVRRAKSAIGDVLVFGGAATTMYGSHKRDEGVALAGLGAIVAGMLAKAGAKGDTRYCEYMPASIYLAPLRLEIPSTVRLQVDGDPGSVVQLNLEPGTTRSPRVLYLRVHGRGVSGPPWLLRHQPVYGNDHTGVRPGDYPWILGGQDVSTPTRQVLEAYQANGYLLNFTLSDLQELYDAEDILIGSGMENRPDRLRNPSFRHILEGGRGLFTPAGNSMGYKRLMCNRHPPYEPKSELVRNVAASIRVQHEPDYGAPPPNVIGRSPNHQEQVQ